MGKYLIIWTHGYYFTEIYIANIHLRRCETLHNYDYYSLRVQKICGIQIVLSLKQAVPISIKYPSYTGSISSLKQRHTEFGTSLMCICNISHKPEERNFVFENFLSKMFSLSLLPYLCPKWEDSVLPNYLNITKIQWQIPELQSFNILLLLFLEKAIK